MLLISGAVANLAVSGRDARLERADYINVIADDNVASGNITEGRVEGAGGVASERTDTVGRVSSYRWCC